MKHFFQRIGAFFVREIRLILWILTVGGVMVLISIVLLAMNHEWESTAEVFAYTGLRILYFGYPLLILVRVLKKMLTGEKKS